MPVLTAHKCQTCAAPIGLPSFKAALDLAKRHYQKTHGGQAPKKATLSGAWRGSVSVDSAMTDEEAKAVSVIASHGPGLVFDFDDSLPLFAIVLE